MLENLHEVFNVGASIFNRPGGPHVKLHNVHEPGEALPGDVRGWLAQPGARLDVAIEVPRYGEGRLGVIDVLF